MAREYYELWYFGHFRAIFADSRAHNVSELTDQNFPPQVVREEVVGGMRPAHLLPILGEVGEEAVGGNIVLLV